ncbi:hypothetical protein JVU11DRAFT_8705 [Chiua virens]|nr:hypothetical protein JVU11DRAFT_8705 [Chiua virens]
MESNTHRLHAHRQRQCQIRDKIRKLQEQLVDVPADHSDTIPQSPKRKHRDATLLAPATPSPRKKRRIGQAASHKLTDGRLSTAEHPWQESARSAVKPASVTHHAKPAPSNVLHNLATLRHEPTPSDPSPVVRSSDLAEIRRPKLPELCALQERGTDAPIASTSCSIPQRDESLAIIEDIQIGPADHKPPPDDLSFARLEPNSGIHLLSRSLTHEDLQEYLRGRYYLSPSRLYSCIRLLPNKSGYDVPVEGDWVTIAVVAERGPVRHTRAPVDIAPGDDGRASGDETGSKPTATRKTSDKKGPKGPPKPHGKKYVSMKLIDFGARSRPSALAGKSVIRGDAFLSLLLFESDGFDKLTGEDGNVKKIYQGGSKGAFEAMSKLKEGDVVALLNPKVLKPFQRNDKTPHPVDNILAVTPESATSIAIVGRARDLGMCKLDRQEGERRLRLAFNQCGAKTACWESRIHRRGMTTTSARKRKPEHDPSRQWGLQPEPAAPSSVYIVSGHVVGSAGGDMFMSEKMGREAQERAKRRLGQDADKELKLLLDRDKEGMKAVTKAREVAANMLKATEREKRKAGKTDKGKGKGKAVEEVEEPESESGNTQVPAKPAYSANVIKHLGFDPAAKVGRKRAEDLSIQKKLEALAAIQESRRDINLARRPGTKIRSGVSIPAFMLEEDSDTEFGAEGSDSDLEVVSGEREMVDLDDSSDIE